MGLGPLSVLEVEDKKNLGMSAEAALLERVIPKGAVICALDERGAVMPSPKFADKLEELWREAITKRDLMEAEKRMGWLGRKLFEISRRKRVFS